MKYIPAIFKQRYYHPVTLATIGLMAALALGLLIWADLISWEPYRMILVDEQHSQGQTSGYYDLDNDGVSEFLVFKTYGLNYPNVEIYYGRDEFIDVIRPRGTWFNGFPSFLTGDFDLDSLAEIYLFTFSNDSILLNGYEPLGDDKHFLVNQFIDMCGNVNGKNDAAFAGASFNDENGDGFMELSFILRAGFSLYPRRLYRIDIQQGILRSGFKSGAGFSGLLRVDLNGDGKKDYVALTNALQNFPVEDSSILFSDNSAWLIGIDNDLGVNFAVEFSDEKPYLNGCIREIDGEKVIILMVYEVAGSHLKLLKYNLKGELLEDKQILHDGYRWFLNESDYMLEDLVVSDMNNIYIYDDHFTLIKELGTFGRPITFIDRFMFKRITGFQLFQKNNEISLVNHGMKVQGTLKLKSFGISQAESVSLISSESQGSFRCSVRTVSDGEFIIDVKKRKISRPNILVHPLFYLLFYLFFYALFRFQYYFFNKRIRTEQNIHSLQLQSIQNQLQPHFTFNVLNSIGSLIYKNQKDAAYEYLNYFSDMLRSTLTSSRQSDWTIDEELHFIKTYVAMENLRFDNKFDFKVDISPGTDVSFKIPKLMVQTFVDNAISHGLMHKKEDCRLEVVISGNYNHIIIRIKDNGIGRLAAGKIERDHTGQGNEILLTYIEVYNKINKVKFGFTIQDLFDANAVAAGTEVILRIPKDYSGKTRGL